MSWSTTWPPGCSRSGSSPSNGSRSPAATRVEWIARRPGDHVRGRRHHDGLPLDARADDVAYILADSGSQIVVAEDAAQLAKLRAHRDELAAVRKVVLVDGRRRRPRRRARPVADHARGAGRRRPRAPGRAGTRGRRRCDRRRGARAPRHPDVHLGHHRPPQGRRAHARQLVLRGGCRSTRLGLLRPDHLQYLWLPLSHSFGKVLLSGQLQIGFTTAVDGRVDKIVDNLGVIKPTFMAGAPRIFEKVYARVVLDDAGGGRRQGQDLRLGDRGRRKDVAARRAAGSGVPVAARPAAQASPTRWCSPRSSERMGGRIDYFVSGSAALSRDVGEWFERRRASMILEGYGLTETSAGSMRQPPGTQRRHRRHSRCRAPRSRSPTTARCCCVGPGVMRGYHNLPEQTAEVLLADGWLATGDIGEIDDDGRPADHRPQEGPDQDLRRQVHRAAADRGAVQGAVPVAVQTSWCTPRAATSPRRSSRSTPTRRRRSSRRRGIGGTPEDWSTGSQGRAVGTGCDRELNADLNRWETIKDFRILRARPLGRGRRAHAQPEDQAQGRRDPLRRRAGVDVHALAAQRAAGLTRRPRAGTAR